MCPEDSLGTPARVNLVGSFLELSLMLSGGGPHHVMRGKR